MDLPVATTTPIVATEIATSVVTSVTSAPQQLPLSTMTVVNGVVSPGGGAAPSAILNGNGVKENGVPPADSPLTGGYLLIIVGEAHSQEHKDIILQKVAKGKKLFSVSIFNLQIKSLSVSLSTDKKSILLRKGSTMIVGIRYSILYIHKYIYTYIDAAILVINYCGTRLKTKPMFILRKSVSTKKI